MLTLLSPTEDFIKRNRTRLSADVNAGDNAVIPTENSDGILENDYIVVGPEGSDQAEICQVASVTEQSITVAVLRKKHFAYEPIVKYRYNQRKFYGCTTEGGSYAELTSDGSPAAIAVNDPQGTYFEYTTDEGYIYFKSTYWNVQTSEETDIAQSVAVLADESVRYCSIFAIRKQAGMTNNPFLTDGIIEIYRKRAENEVNSYLYNRYDLPLVNQSESAPEVPFIVENVTTLLAAGYMDYQEFGSDGEGVKWLGEARAVLKAVQNGVQRLIASDYQEFQTKTQTQGINSYPNTVDNTGDGGPSQHFTMDQLF